MSRVPRADRARVPCGGGVVPLGVGRIALMVLVVRPAGARWAAARVRARALSLYAGGRE
jgi:hypothetical protein